MSDQVVIIGAGVSGLTAGLALLKMGFPVTVVEQNPRPGGMMRGYVRSSVDCPVGVHYICGLAPGEPLRNVWDWLGLSPHIPVEPMGGNGVIDHYSMGEDQYDLPVGLDAFQAALLDAFPGDAPAVAAVMDRLRPAAAKMSSLSALWGRGPVSDLEDTASSRAFMVEAGCSSRLLDVLSVSSHLVGASPDDCPLWLHFTTLAAYLSSPWRLAGASTQMAEAYADRYNALGGRLLTGRAATGILMDGGRASGVELADGRRIPAAQVVAAIHPKFVLGLLPREAVPDGLRRRVENFRESPAVFCLHGLVDADALPARPYNIYRIKERGHDGRRDVAFIQVRSSRRPGRNLVTAIHNSAYNDWRPWFDTRTGSRGAEYNRAKRARADLLIQDVRAETGFDGPIDIIDTFSPLSLRDWVGAPEGGCYGVEHTSDQMIGLMRLARKAAPGLHFIGHSIMAPGILGATLGALNGVGRIAGRDRLARAIGV